MRLRSLGADVIEAKRGGQLTFHGPGQLMGYIITDTRRHGVRRSVPRELGDYLRTLLLSTQTNILSPCPGNAFVAEHEKPIQSWDTSRRASPPEPEA